MVILRKVYYILDLFGSLSSLSPEAVLLQEKAKEMHDFTVKASAASPCRADYAD